MGAGWNPVYALIARERVKVQVAIELDLLEPVQELDGERLVHAAKHEAVLRAELGVAVVELHAEELSSAADERHRLRWILARH